MKKSEYGHGVATRNAGKREQEILKILESSNRLKYYAMPACIFAVITFFSWCFFWSYYQGVNVHCTNEAMLLGNQTCAASEVAFDIELHQYVSMMTAGILFSFFITQVLQLLEYEVRNSFRVTAVYCTAVINIIAAIAHYSMARGWFPKAISIFGRINHVARWGEWVSLVPLLMIMMTSLDVRNQSERQLIFEATVCQLVSVVLGGTASLSSNYLLSIIFMVISCTLYLHLYYVLWRSLNHYNKLTTSKDSKTKETIQHHSDTKDQEKSITVRDATSQVELLTATMSVKLVIVCTFTWTIKIMIYGLGVMNLITNTHEAIAQSLTDCVSKGIYARTLCTSHGTTMSPESLLRRMLLLEEQANASIRQVTFSTC
jgi:hypothetical protein